MVIRPTRSRVLSARKSDSARGVVLRVRSTMRRAYALRPACLGLLSLMLGIACNASDSLIVRTAEPVIMVIVSPLDSLTTNAFYDTRMTALVATSGVPTNVEYRTAETFEMTRGHDGARFVFVPIAPPPLRPGTGLIPENGNYALPESAVVAGTFGRRVIRAGERFRLRIVTAGREITGETTVPLAPRPVLVSPPTAAERRVAWSPVPGVSLYFVAGARLGPTGTTTDTTALIDEDANVSTGARDGIIRVRVTALDANFTRFLRDSTLAASGVQGGYGVFGAASSGELRVPELSRLRQDR